MDRSEDCRLDLHLFAADMRFAVAVTRFLTADRQSILALVDCDRSRSGSEVENTPEALRLAVDCWGQRSKVELQCTVRVHGQQVYYL